MFAASIMLLVMADKPVTTCRFVVMAEDGRRSAVWRVWTGDKRPTDEVYAAHRMRASEVKFSLHSSGYRQFGHTRSIRGAMRAGDRAAIARWKRVEGAQLGEWDIALMLSFADSELRAIPGEIGSNVTRIPTAPDGQQTVVLVLTAESPVDDPDIGVIAALDREVGRRTVAIGALRWPVDPNQPKHHELRSELSASIPLVIQGIVNPEPFDLWFGETAGGGAPLALELARDEVESLPPLPPFKGEVLPWDECPADQLREEQLFCGLLVIQGDGNRQLYVDQRARCNHAELGRYAHELCDEAETDGYDGGWGHFSNGDRWTGISRPVVLDDHQLEWQDGGVIGTSPFAG